MPYRYLDDIATADIGFEAWSATLEGLMIEAADAVMNVMVEDLETLARRQTVPVVVEDNREEMLLFQVLQELIYQKDANRLFLRLRDVHIERREDGLRLEARGEGEEIDMARHSVNVDVKAVTLHRFSVVQTETGWRATVVLDI